MPGVSCQFGGHQCGGISLLSLVPRKLRAEAPGVRMVQLQGLGVYINEFKSVQAYHIGKTLPTKNKLDSKTISWKPLIPN